MKTLSRFFVLFFSTLSCSVAFAQSVQYTNYLNYVVNWNQSAKQAYKSLSPNSSVASNTLGGQVDASVYLQLLNSIRMKEFTAESLAQAPTFQVMQFKTQSMYSSKNASRMLDDGFWNAVNFQKLAGAQLDSQAGKQILSYDISIATISCQYQQKILTSHHTDWNFYKKISEIVAPDMAKSKVLSKIVVQSCEQFSHLMTHNLQINFVFQDDQAPSQQRVYLVGYNQSFVKESSMGKLKLAFFLSGVEKGIADEIYKRFLKLDENVRNALH